MTGSVAAISAAGFLLGFRHAFEPDHLAAVATLSCRQGRIRAAAGLGIAWATGHTAAVGLAALALIWLGIQLPAAVFEAAELFVAALLVALGVRLAFRHAHRHAHPARDTRQSLGFGVMHGIAGGGAIAALLVAAVPGAGNQLACYLAFGAGTLSGMLGVSAATAVAAEGARRRSLAPALHLAAAAASVFIGLRLAASVLGN